ncbi:signal protein [Actinophytocola xinjiangensis]|uniref:Signal protein n=1 Tax=Actinophytocola xinjiangensis TaxID=485602 RepID=A0A7Z1B0W4_9PSEU|nr:MHYT domain-containing protein [Actinophytocola xinjiangensis]OLF13074.1 signal protein [Actinophytocola xinjiangensis]
MNHFHLGTWLLVFAYATSVVGCTVGLACTRQARHATGRSRHGWLALAAVSIGGVGIWLMHFIAMLGFDTPGFPVRYDIPRTVFSAVLAVGAVYCGLLVFGARTDTFSRWRLLVGGVITGLAVNLMHYSGMWALRIKGTISYVGGLVALSVLIAVVAATAALLFTVVTNRLVSQAAAGLVMGVAVTGMHYTGMAAMRVTLDAAAPDPGGVEVFSFLFPVFVLGVVALAVPISAVLMAPARPVLVGARPVQNH